MVSRPLPRVLLLHTGGTLGVIPYHALCNAIYSITLSMLQDTTLAMHTEKETCWCALHQGNPCLACSSHSHMCTPMCACGRHLSGMDPETSYEADTLDGHVQLKHGTGGSFSPPSALRPGRHILYLPLLTDSFCVASRHVTCKLPVAMTSSEPCDGQEHCEPFLAVACRDTSAALGLVVCGCREDAAELAEGSARAECVCQPEARDPLQQGQQPRWPRGLVNTYLCQQTILGLQHLRMLQQY